MPDASTTVQIEDDKSRLILLELVRDKPYSYFLPSNVTGWRPFGDFDGTDFEQPPPVCSWTGVTCDSNDGSITGLNLGDGFYFITLLGNVVAEDDDDHSSTRRMVRSREYDIILNNKRRYSDKLSPSRTTIRRRDDETTQSTIGPTIPYSLGKLHSLRFLNLSYNQIHGSLPKSILQLPKLEIIDISNNVLTGIFPHFTSPAITVLDISKNQFHGSLPKHIFGHPVLDSSTSAPYLTTVVKFDISHNNFIGTIPLDGTSGAYDSSSGAEHRDKLLQNLKYFDLGYNMCEYTMLFLLIFDYFVFSHCSICA
jgi:Leucine-rich repeat (LRR) protein